MSRKCAMRTLDKFLLSIAAFSLIAIITIFFTDSLKPVGVQVEENSEKDELLVYNEEIDKEIAKYFQIISQNPSVDEEDSRLTGDDQLMSERSSQKSLMSMSNLAPEKKDEKNVPGASKQSVRKSNAIISKHTVKKGESLWRIAQRYNVPVYTIVSANPHKSKNIIRPGEVLKIPTKKGVIHRVKRGEYLSKIASKYKVNLSRIRNANRILSNSLKVGQELFIPEGKPLPSFRFIDKKLFIWPLRGRNRLTSRFGWRRSPISGRRQFHPGLDIGAKYGTRIVASASGVVVFAGRKGAYGNILILRHRNGYFSAYAHCSRLLVRRGKYVKQGRLIARVGSTGISTGPHLHFEVRKFKRQINPFVALRKKIKVKVPFG